ncbi:lipase family alpha/beta hydrolase [Providencia stuartii]
MKKQEKSIQYYFGEFDEKKRIVWKNIQTQYEECNTEAHCYLPPHKVVPVIFLPGIMGSNLKNKKSDRSIWRIRSNELFMFWDALGWAFTGGKRRKKLLHPNEVVTDFNQKVGNDDNESNYFPYSREQRGWGSALAFSYFKPLEKLQAELLFWEQYYNKAKTKGRFVDSEEEDYFRKKSILGKILGEPLSSHDTNPLSIDETINYRSLLLPLHVFGYNWLQDNAESAKQLAVYINEVLNMYNLEENGGIGNGLAFEKGHEKVILVTHSMGGLVARYASELLKIPYRDKILGVVHGVMPDLGSPTAYKMMKIGEHSFPMSMVLGASATRLMSVLAQSPAPMQLLPSPKYNEGKPWLRIEKGSPDGVTDLFLPRTNPDKPEESDPFNDIYLQEKVWWRMYESDILDKDERKIKANFIEYKNLMEWEVKTFMQEMDNQYHSNTYQFYGAYFDENLPKDKRRSDETVTWKLQGKTSWLWVSDDSRDTNEYGDKREYTLIKSNNNWNRTKNGKEEGGAGDGTVPTLSINLNAQARFKEILPTNVEHQDAYRFDPWKGDSKYKYKGAISLAIQFTLRSLCRILQTDEVKPK